MKDRIGFWLKHVLWVLLGMGVFFLVLLPWVSNFTSLSQSWDYNAFDNYSDYVWGLLPFTCVIANILVQKEYVEGGARELLTQDYADIVMSIVNTVLQVLMFLPLYIYFEDDSGMVTDLLAEIVLIVFVMNGISMAITYGLKEPAITILLMLGYTVISNGKVLELMEDVVLPFRIHVNQGQGMNSPYYMNFLLVGLLAWVVGVIQSLRRRSVC